MSWKDHEISEFYFLAETSSRSSRRTTLRHLEKIMKTVNFTSWQRRVKDDY